MMLQSHGVSKDTRSHLFEYVHDGAIYRVYFLDTVMWMELLFWIIAAALFASAVAVVIYAYVLKNRPPQTRKKSWSPSCACFMTFGILVPMWILLPVTMADVFGIQNKIFRFSFCMITPTTGLFRSIEAYFGFAPEFSAGSLSAYVVYFACPLRLLHDGQTNRSIKATNRQKLRYLSLFTVYCFLTGGFQSLFALLEGMPTLGSSDSDLREHAEAWYYLNRLFSMRQIFNNLCYAILLQLYLCTFSEGFQLVTALITGCSPEPMMLNPLFESTSPSDFWGRRWNRLIHHCLKNGAYKPVRSLGGGRGLATIVAFFASGAFHEWLLPCVFFDYNNTHGVTMIFFLWQAVLVMADFVLGSSKLFDFLGKSLGNGVLRSLCVVMLGVPLAHWFCDSYVRSDFFHQGNILFPCIVRVPAQSQ